MTTKTTLNTDHAFQQMLHELNLLKAEYANQWNNRKVLLEWGKPQLEALYYARIGEFKIELLHRQAEIFAAKRKLEMMQAAINRNEEISMPYIGLMVEMEMQEQLKKLKDEVANLHKAKNLLAHLDTAERSNELRKIFREMAKQLHPDINPGLGDGAKNLWNAAMLAYDTGDLESLRALRLLVTDVTNKVEEFADQNTLPAQINLLKQGISRLLNEIKNIRNEFPFVFEEQLNNQEWISEQQAILKKETEAAVEQKLYYEKTIALLIQSLDL